MQRAIRCPSCGNRFYTEVGSDARECQNCDGSYDPVEQLKADIETVRKANARPQGKSQQVDPRAPANPTTPKKGK